VFGGQIISSELERIPFNTPAGIPLYNNADGKISKGPSFLAQFYGRKVHYKPKLNITQFIEQFAQIEVYGVETCQNSFDTSSFISCFVQGIEQPIIRTDCV
jgi:hypothetical protein